MTASTCCFAETPGLNGLGDPGLVPELVPK